MDLLRSQAGNMSVPIGRLAAIMATDVNASGLAGDLQLIGGFLDGVPKPAAFLAAVVAVDTGAHPCLLPPPGCCLFLA